MNRLFAGLLLLLASCASNDDGPSSSPSPPSTAAEQPLVMPELAPLSGMVIARIEGDDVTFDASFGVEEDRCEALIRDGACAAEQCIPARRFQIVPNAGTIEVVRPNGRIHNLVPMDTYYESISAKLSEPATFVFKARGGKVPPFEIAIDAPGPLFGVALPGADPRSPNSDLEIAHEPFEAGFELIMRNDTGPRLHCSFPGGPAVVPKSILSALEPGTFVRASAFRLTRQRVTIGDYEGDYTIDAIATRDHHTFEFRLTRAEASSGP